MAAKKQAAKRTAAERREAVEAAMAEESGATGTNAGPFVIVKELNRTYMVGGVRYGPGENVKMPEKVAKAIGKTGRRVSAEDVEPVASGAAVTGDVAGIEHSEETGEALVPAADEGETTPSKGKGKTAAKSAAKRGNR